MWEQFIRRIEFLEEKKDANFQFWNKLFWGGIVDE